MKNNPRITQISQLLHQMLESGDDMNPPDEYDHEAALLHAAAQKVSQDSITQDWVARTLREIFADTFDHEYEIDAFSDIASEIASVLKFQKATTLNLKMRIAQLVHQHNLQCKEEIFENGTVTYIMQNGNIDLDLTVVHHYIHGVESSGLPREMYFHEPTTIEDENARTEEIMGIVEGILEKRFTFHLAPRIFSKHRGYITLTVHGKPRKIYQKRNFFALPVAKISAQNK